MVEKFNPNQFNSYEKLPDKQKPNFKKVDDGFVYNEALSKKDAEIEAEKIQDKIKSGEAKEYNEASNLIEKESLFKKIEKALAQDTPKDHTSSESLDAILTEINGSFPGSDSEGLKNSIVELLKKYEDCPNAGALIALALQENAVRNKDLELIRYEIEIFSDPLAQEIIKKFESTGEGDEGCQISRIGELSIYHKDKSMKLLPFYYKAVLNYIDAPWMGEYIGRAVDYVSSKSAQTKLEIYAKPENAQQIKEAIEKLNEYYSFKNKIIALSERGSDDKVFNLIDQEYQKVEEKIQRAETIDELKLAAESVNVLYEARGYLFNMGKTKLGDYLEKHRQDLQDLVESKIKQSYLDIEIEPKNETKVINFFSDFGITSIKLDWEELNDGLVGIRARKTTNFISKDKVAEFIARWICFSGNPFAKVISRLEKENEIDLRPYS